jgi:hypothetical protein
MANTNGVSYFDGTSLVTTAVGNAGEVLTSNGVGVAPTFQAAATDVDSITGDTGGAQTGAITLTGGTTGASFGGAAGTITMTFAGITANAGVVNLGSDNTSNAINIGTGAAARTITIGNTTGATAVNVDIGTGDYTVDSATGHIINARDTGEISYPLQPAFLGRLNAADANATGAGATYTLGSPSALVEVFDQNGDFTTAGVFTAPVTGKYQLNGAFQADSLTTAMTLGVGAFVASNGTYRFGRTDPGQFSTNSVQFCGGNLIDMDAADTCTLTLIILNGAGNTASVGGGGAGGPFPTYFSGFLAC